MSKIWLTADTHFCHANILKYENRPFQDVKFTEEKSTELMDSEIIRRWNNVVAKTDKVFHLGDVGFAEKEKLRSMVSALNGHKTLIMGNHDIGRNTAWWRDVGFEDVSRYPIVIEDFIVLQHSPPTYFNDATPFAFIYGHVHATEIYKTITKTTACVCVERWDYTPVGLDKIRELMLLA
jgi:calcineurin-like phosphoesterase family protein